MKRAALGLHRHLQAIGLESFPLLTGGKGIHVVVPLTPTAEWKEVREFAKGFCTTLAEAEPDRFTVAIAKAKRKGRIFLDYLRNQRTATAIMPYSARARPALPVAAPIAWSELDRIDRAALFSTGDALHFMERAASPALRDWGEADQLLPRV